MVKLYREFVISTLVGALCLHYGPHLGGVYGFLLICIGSIEIFTASVNALILTICAVTGLRPPDR